MILMISSLLFPVTGRSVYSFSPGFPDVCKRRGAKFSLRAYSEKKHSWNTFLLLQEADRMTPIAARELHSDKPLSLVCFCVLNTKGVRTSKMPEAQSAKDDKDPIRMPCCGVNSNLAF